MGLQKFGTPEPVEPVTDPEAPAQGVDTESIRRQAATDDYDPQAILAEGDDD